MQGVAAGASDVAGGVGAGRPVMRHVALMAAKALCVLLERGSDRFAAEIHHACERAAAGFDMRAPRSVAGLALQLAMAKRPMWIIRSCVFGTENAGNARIAVTSEASIRAVRAIGRIRVRGPVGGERVMSKAAQ